MIARLPAPPLIVQALGLVIATLAATLLTTTLMIMMMTETMITMNSL